jgi:hypothetical protein
MLSSTARQEILRKLESNVGFPVWEQNLTQATRQAITNLATVQRHLFVITELLRGEKSRVERSTILSIASKLGRDSEKGEKAQLLEEIGKLQAEVDSKVSELSKQILVEEDARRLGVPPPEYKGSLEVIQLKCPQCGASLPMPTGSIMQCQYCKSSFTVQEVSNQIRSMIQSI